MKWSLGCVSCHFDFGETVHSNLNIGFNASGV